MQGGVYDLIAFAKKVGAESAMFLVGSDSELPKYEGTVYLADVATCGEYNPDVHKQLLLEIDRQGQAGYGDLLPLFLWLGPGPAGGTAP